MSHDISWLTKCTTFCKQRLMFIHIYITLVRLAVLSTKNKMKNYTTVLMNACISSINTLCQKQNFFILLFFFYFCAKYM